MTTILGISCQTHDAGIAVLADGELVFATHTERYSRVKNDHRLVPEALDDALAHVDGVDQIVYYERPWSKLARELRSGSLRSLRGPWPRGYLRAFDPLREVPIEYVDHHHSHAAAGYFTSGFRDASVVVVDAIGGWNTISVWDAHGTNLRRVATVNYPHSVGLLYSAFTRRIGFKPNEEEYIVMGLASYGQPRYAETIRQDFIASADWPEFRLRRSVHRGVEDWRPEIVDRADLAASIQEVVERLLHGLFEWVRSALPSRNLVYGGGVALNCRYNGMLARAALFDDVWIMPSPGDAGSGLGAALAAHERHVPWPGPYLGHDIGKSLDVDEALKRLLAGEIVGVAHGRAEFGPRALGNRSLLTDPRDPDAKRRVNEIKRREPFRPFAPVVLADRVHDVFDLPVPASPYMQFLARSRDPTQHLAVCHVDGTSRVQTLSHEQNPPFWELLRRFDEETGCPALLNTSLNVKGQPLVNSLADARQFEDCYGVPVL